MEKSSVNNFWKGKVSLSGPVLEFFVVFLSNETGKIITSVSLFRKVHWIQETFKGWCSVSVQHICFGKVFMACDSRNPRFTYILVFVLVLMVTKCSVLFHIQPDWKKKQKKNNINNRKNNISEFRISENCTFHLFYLLKPKQLSIFSRPKH